MTTSDNDRLENESQQPPDPTEELNVEQLGHCDSLGRHHVPTDFYETGRHIAYPNRSVWVCTECGQKIERFECYAGGCSQGASGVYEILLPPSAVVERKLCDDCGDELDHPPIRTLVPEEDQ